MEPEGGVLIWFEGSAAGRAALAHAAARRQDEWLTVVTIATQERVIGCGRCLQGTVVWNLEMKKIAQEDLREARLTLDGAEDVSFQWLVGAPAEAIIEAARRIGAETIVLPWLRNGRLTPPNRRHVAERVAAAGPWRVVVAPNPAVRAGTDLARAQFDL